MPVQHIETDPCTTIQLPHDVSSVGAARQAMVDDLNAHGVPTSQIDDAELVLSELVANACEHGRPYSEGSIEVSWCVHEDQIRISVLDGGDVSHLEPLPLNLDSLRGRGLQLVDYVCDNWTTDNELGTRVTAELGL